MAAAAGTAVVCCPVCGGRGFRVLHPCSCCGGEGLTQQPRRVAVHVPAGVDSGSTLRLGAEGSVGRASGPRGAVVLELKASWRFVRPLALFLLHRRSAVLLHGQRWNAAAAGVESAIAARRSVL